MKFENQRFITKGIEEKVNPLLQVFVWHCIDQMPEPKDYLQVFDCSVYDGKQKIIHSQEEPEFEKEYLFIADAPFFVGEIFVIDDEAHSTMLLAEEY